jgi:ABC-type nitrate/sulfonate/bicarbonate transport system substrate-binding protein
VRRLIELVVLPTLALLILGMSAMIDAASAETLRVGTAVSDSFTFLPVRVGIAKGFFPKDGLDINVIDFQGGAKVHQGMVADAIDIAVAGSTDFQFLAKGSPELAVAAKSSRPPLGIIVGWDFPGTTIADLKGRKIGVTSFGSLTEWLIRRLVRRQGWKPDDVTLVQTGGGFDSETALLMTHQIDATLGSPAKGLQLALTQRARLLLPSFDVGDDFLAEVLFASKKILADDPNGVRQFLKAWFEIIAWMRTHKSETVDIVIAFTKFTPEVEGQEYDLQMPYLSDDGKFHPAALKTLQEAFVEMGTFDKPPDMSQFYTEAYLPSAPRP